MQGIDRNALTERLLTLRPSILVIMDDRQYAIDIKRRLPDCYVIARDNFAGGKMDDIHRDISPESMVAHYASLAGTGVAAYIENESNWTPRHIEWELQVAQLAYNAGLPVVLGNWAVGQPEPELFDSGALDRLLRWCSDPKHNATIGLHEGALNQLSPLDGWDDDARFGWLSGRFWLWIERCETLGITPSMFAFTEWTVDAPAMGMRGVGAFMDYWRAQGIQDPTAHLFNLIAESWRRMYAPGANYVYGLAWYCAGHVTPDWIPYDLLTQAPGVLDLAANHSWPGGELTTPDTPDDIEDNPMPDHAGTQITITHSYDRLNFRSTPYIGNNIIATLGSSVTAYTDYVTVTADGYEWLKIRYGSLEGWIAYDGANNHHVDIEPPVPSANDNSAAVDKLRVAIAAIQDAIAELDA